MSAFAGRAVALAALLAVPVPLAGQGAGGGGLTLAEALAHTLQDNAQVQGARWQLRASEGRRLAAGAALDPVVQTSVGGSQDQQTGAGPDGAPVLYPGLGTRYAVNASKLLSSGILIQPTLSLESSGRRDISVQPTNAATVSLQVQVPLLQDRWGSVSLAGPRAADALLAADEAGLRQALAASVLEVASAYWEYVAAQRRLAVYTSSEERAARLIEETRVLVRAEERAAADLNQGLANLASKRVARIAAEQTLLQAKRRLGLAMGVSPAAVMSLPPAADSFPTPRPFQADSAATAALVATALGGRPELQSARERQRSARVLVEAAASTRRPRLDVVASVGYAGLQTGNGLGGFVKPLYRDVPGPNAAFELRYAFPLRNADARGLTQQREAAAAQEDVGEVELRRQIVTGVELAAEALRRSVLSLAEAAQAVELYRSTVAAEQQKNRLGVGTLFDVILAQDNLTNALLVEVGTRSSYAVALATLRYETGTLLAGTVPDPGVLLTPP